MPREPGVDLGIVVIAVISVVLSVLFGCTAPEQDGDPPGPQGDDDDAADDDDVADDDDNAGESGELTLSCPSTFVIGEPADIAGTASGDISRVTVACDGWEIADEAVGGDGTWSFEYAFDTAGLGRQLVVQGWSSAGTLLDEVSASIDVIDDGGNWYVEGVPYFYQYDNTNNPSGSCQNTSMAMVLLYYGATGETPDEISNYYGTSQAQTVSGYEDVFNAEAEYFGLSVRDDGTTTGTLAELHDLLDQGLPTVVHGYFTGYGHVIVLLGHDGNRYMANDPAGVWNEQYMGGGYTGNDPTGGRYVTYDAAAVDQAIAPDGNVWMHQLYFLW